MSNKVIKKEPREVLHISGKSPLPAAPAAGSGCVAAAGAARDRGAGGVPARDRGGAKQTHSVGNNFAAKASSAPVSVPPAPSVTDSDAGDTLYTLDNIASRFGVSAGVMAPLFARLDQSAGELVIQRDRTALATSSGLEKISVMLAAAAPPPVPPPVASPAPSVAPEPPPRATAYKDTADLTVVRVRNHKRLTAKLPSGAFVVCEVQRTEKFIPGMTIKNCARCWGNIYRFTGRLPRRKGRW